jgi:hypothetical protein
MVTITPQGHALGLTLAHPDPRNWPYMLSASAPPANTNWRGRMLPRGQQGPIGAYTGWGGTAAVEAKRMDGVQRSPLFVYWFDRAVDGTAANQDAGATMLALCKALRDYGCPPDGAWPYDPSQFAVKPSIEAQVAALDCRVESFYQVQGTGGQLLQGMWAAIQEGPFPIALKVFDSFEHPDDYGRVPTPGAWEQMLGGHCICAVDWENDSSAPGGYGWWLCDNSWGDELGDHGRWRIPTTYVTQGVIVEAHVLRLAAAPQPEPEPEEPTVDRDAIEQRQNDIRANVEYVQGLRPTSKMTKSQILAVVEDVWTHQIGPFDDLARESIELLGPKP